MAVVNEYYDHHRPRNTDRQIYRTENTSRKIRNQNIYKFNYDSSNPNGKVQKTQRKSVE